MNRSSKKRLKFSHVFRKNEEIFLEYYHNLESLYFHTNSVQLVFFFIFIRISQKLKFISYVFYLCSVINVILLTTENCLEENYNLKSLRPT